MKTTSRWALGLGAALMAVAGMAQAVDLPNQEFGILGGAGMMDKNLVGSKKNTISPVIGLRYGTRLGTSTNFFSDLTYNPVKGSLAGVGNSDVTTLRGGLEWLFSKQQDYNWFLSGGLGLVNYSTDKGPNFTEPLASVGLGQEWAVGKRDAFRWEVRAQQSFGNNDNPVQGHGLSSVQALLGYSWGLGEQPAPPPPAPAPPPPPAPTPAPPPPAPAPAPTPVPPPAPAQKKIVLQGINFGFNKYSIGAKEQDVLDNAVATLKEWGDGMVLVAGYTDSVGSKSYNLRLSKLRADAVKNYLVKHGIPAARLETKGFGEADPIASNKTAAGRYQNRRVELTPAEKH